MPKTLSTNVEIVAFVFRLEVAVANTQHRLHFTSILGLFDDLHGFPKIFSLPAVRLAVAPVLARLNRNQVARSVSYQLHVDTVDTRLLTATALFSNEDGKLFQKLSKNAFFGRGKASVH